MTEAQKILEMIESVDVSDTDTLDEIDWRVDCWLVKKPFTSVQELNDSSSLHFAMGGILHRPEQYTRSRDALKAIRPEGWPNIEVSIYNGSVSAYISDGMRSLEAPYSLGVPTEELAELHAIIQAIEWERNNDRTTGESND